MTLLYNIFEICRIHYGQGVITKTTLRPYYICLVNTVTDLLLIFIYGVSLSYEDVDTQARNLTLLNILYSVEFLQLNAFMVFIAYVILDI